jgi:hypothetical protein
MYIESYEIATTVTSAIIMSTSIYILYCDHNYMIIFIILSGFLSCLTRLYRIKQKEYIMDHPLVYMDIIFAILAFITYLWAPSVPSLYYPILWAFILMIIAAIMSWNIFSINLVKESFFFQLLGHIIISVSLLYYIIINL